MQDITGGVISWVVTITVAVSVFPAASVALIITLVVVAPVIVDPATGFCVFTIAPAGVQLSVTTSVVRKSGTSAWQLLLRLRVGFAGGIITGLVTSTTVTFIIEFELFPDASVAVIVTGVIPVPTIVPATGF